MLSEYQIDDDMKKDEIEQKIIERLKLLSFDDIDPNKVSDFVNDNYDLLITDVDSIPGNILLKNYVDYLKKTGLTESIIRIIKEADEIDEIDKIQLFQDLADIQSTLYDGFAKLYVYKGQYMEDRNVLSALSQIRLGISQVVNKIATILESIGLNDIKRI